MYACCPSSPESVPAPLAGSPPTNTCAGPSTVIPTPVVGACSANETVEMMSAPSSKPYHSTWKVQPGCGVLFGMRSSSPSGAIFTVPLLPAGSPLPSPWFPALPLP